jgi:hypothetical protein
MEVTCPKCGAAVSVTLDDSVPVKVTFGDLTVLDRLCPQVMGRQKTGGPLDYLCDTLTDAIGHLVNRAPA